MRRAIAHVGRDRCLRSWGCRRHCGPYWHGSRKWIRVSPPGHGR